MNNELPDGVTQDEARDIREDYQAGLRLGKKWKAEGHPLFPKGQNVEAWAYEQLRRNISIGELNAELDDLDDDELSSILGL